MAQCGKCGAVIAEGREISLQSKDGHATTVCPTCASTSFVGRALKDERENPNMGGAILLGLGAAIISSILWYTIVVLTNYQLGIVAIAVGWLVAQAVMWGAGGKRGPRLQVLSVVITALAMVMSEYLIVHHFTAQALAQQGYTDIPLLLPVTAMFTLVVEGVKADPATLLFWGIALFEGYTLPKVH